MLKIDNLRVNYGTMEVLKGISLEVPDKSIVTLIGAGGAGKTTTLKSVVGLVKPSDGSSITLDGEELIGRDTTDIVSMGFALVPEGCHVCPDMTVIENIRIGAYLRKDSLREDIDWIYDLFPRLKEKSRMLSSALSRGERQMLTVARALMSRPRILMMDEPSQGLAPLKNREIFSIIQKINKKGVTILLVEQNANMVFQGSDSCFILENGRIP